MNVAGLNISDLPKDRHYCRRANKDNFWLDWTKNKMEKYEKKYKGNFFLIFYQSLPPYNYYAIPFTIIKEQINDSHLRNKGETTKVWNGTIDEHKLRITKEGLSPIIIDVSKYYNNYIELSDSDNLMLPNLFSFPQPRKKVPIGLIPDGETFFRRSNSPDGWIYVITNSSWDNWVKIGVTRDLHSRRGNYNTGAPYQEVYYEFFDYIYHEKAREIERLIHDKLSHLRHENQSKEWYNMTPSEAMEKIKQFKSSFESKG